MAVDGIEARGARLGLRPIAAAMSVELVGADLETHTLFPL